MDYSNLEKCICGACEYKMVRKGTYNRLGALNYSFEILKCKKCGLMRTFPTPSSNLYLKNPLSVKNTEEYYSTTDTWSKITACGLTKWCSKGSNILDLGCYTGNLVEWLQRLGFQAIGCDIDSTAIKKGLELARNIRLGTVMECKFQDSFFDTVVCNSSLEHIYELDSTIREIEKILKKNGLFFISVPYFKGLIPKIMGDNWMSWVPHQHVWHFDKKTLQHIVLAHGNFKVISLKSRGMTEPPSVGVKGLAKKIIGKTAGFLNFGDAIEAIFIKK